MITLHFPKSRSAKYNQAVKMAKLFNDYKQDTMNHVNVSVKEVFEKWELFNSLMWTIIDWKGTTIEFDGMNYHSHTDKTRIFYSLQQAHQNWMNHTSYKLIQSYQVYEEEVDFDTVETENLTEDEVNRLIDLYTAKSLKI